MQNNITRGLQKNCLTISKMSLCLKLRYQGTISSSIINLRYIIDSIWQDIKVSLSGLSSKAGTDPELDEEEEELEDEEDDEFLKLRSHLIALRHSRSFDSGLSISKLYQQALLANNKELRKGKYF